MNHKEGDSMPRTKEQFEAMRMATRDKIHSAAIKLFAKKGFAATSVQDIANSAGISTGLLYRHYKTKDDLFNDLVTYAAIGLEKIIETFKTDSSPIEMMGQFTSEIINDFKKDDEFANFLMIMNQASTVDNQSTQVVHLNMQSIAMVEQTAKLIGRGQDLGQFKEGDPMEMAIYFFASIQGLSMLKLTMNERFIAPSPEIVTAFLMK